VAHLDYYSVISVSKEIFKLFSLKELFYHFSVTSTSFRETQYTQKLTSVILERLIGYGSKKLKTILRQVLRKLYTTNQRN